MVNPTDQGQPCVEMMGLDRTAELALEDDDDVRATNGTAPSGGLGEFASGEVGGGGADLGEGEDERVLR